MERKTIIRGAFIGLVLITFAIGFFCGSLMQRDANAQWKEIGKSALEQATGSGGLVGSIADLGTAIVEMEDHISGLQKNVDTLKKVQSALKVIK